MAHWTSTYRFQGRRQILYKRLPPWVMRIQTRLSAFRYASDLDLFAATAYRLWDVESDCRWCKDRWGFSWQITPQRQLDLVKNDDRAEAQRAFEAMMTMKKVDIAALDVAVADLS